MRPVTSLATGLPTRQAMITRHSRSILKQDTRTRAPDTPLRTAASRLSTLYLQPQKNELPVVELPNVADAAKESVSLTRNVLAWIDEVSDAFATLGPARTLIIGSSEARELDTPGSLKSGDQPMTETADAPTAYEADQELSDLTHAHHANVVLPGLEEEEEEVAPFTGHPASDEDLSRGVRSADEAEGGDLD